uniref:Uncharacterized protein n=1 Tax=Leersia perrieri TaxID=77586 RepID=A0A0D9XRH8_9ORYZ
MIRPAGAGVASRPHRRDASARSSCLPTRTQGARRNASALAAGGGRVTQRTLFRRRVSVGFRSASARLWGCGCLAFRRLCHDADTRGRLGWLLCPTCSVSFLGGGLVARWRRTLFRWMICSMRSVREHKLLRCGRSAKMVL